MPWALVGALRRVVATGMFLFRSLLLRRLGPLGAALTLYDVWRRLPPKQRRRLAELARRQGRRVAVRAHDLVKRATTR